MIDDWIERLRRDNWLYPLAVLGFLTAGAIVALAYWYVFSPVRFVVAVGPADGPEARIVQALAETFDQRRGGLRLVVQSHPNVRASAQSLQDGRADLAVVRPDALLPSNGSTIAILREDAVVLLAPASAKIESMADLAGKRLGFVQRHEADGGALRALLAYYDLTPPALEIVPVQPGDVESALRDKRIQALAFIAAPSSDEARQLARAVAFNAKDGASLIPIEEGEALGLRTPALVSMTLPAGAISARPTIPDEEAKTVGVSYRLMARAGLDRGPVSVLTERLFQLRSRIAQTEPAINLMKAPDNDTGTSSVLPNHRGALDYFNREQQTFMDRYGDWLWFALFAGGGLSSGVAWMARLLVRRRREIVDEVLERLGELINEARCAQSSGDLEVLTREIDDLVKTCLRYARQRTTTTRVMSALILAIDSARSAIGDRRAELASSALAPGVQRRREASRE